MTARPTKKKSSRSRPAARTRSKPKSKAALKKSTRKHPQSKGKKTRAARRSITDSKKSMSHLPTATEADTTRRAPLSKGADVLSLLRRDHEKVRKLLAELESSRSADRQASLLEQIENELEMHTHVEEEIFYPAFHDRARTKEDRQLYYEALEEHHAVDVILPEVKRADRGSDKFSARAKVLKEIVEHHAGEEEKEMFPRARKIMKPAELRELGARVAARKRENTSSTSGGLIKSFLGIG
jgi:hemerythrin superfamily protein